MTASMTLDTCEAGLLALTCQSGYSIVTQDMFFGRNSLVVCPHENANTTDCEASEALGVVREHCDGRQECYVSAQHIVLGDPCPGVAKHASVQYACHSKYCIGLVSGYKINLTILSVVP